MHNAKNDSLANRNRITRMDICIYVVLIAFCYVSFAQGDLYLTGNRSWLLYHNSILDFYEASLEWAGNYGANYLIPTFLIFAIWNFPLRFIMGWDYLPRIETSRISLILWYKLLPTIIMAISAYLVYRIAVMMGMKERKSKLCGFAFLTMPVAVYSQFIFSQYDIFTVFFMLCGLFFYYRRQSNKDMWLFCIFFGIAATCKYYSIGIFLILLLLREKSVIRILGYAGVMLVPLALVIAPYVHSAVFIRSVFGFNAVGYINNADFRTIIGGISFFKVAACLIIAYAYFVDAKCDHDQIAWGLYLSCGFCFVVFGLVTFHPQWLLFGVPFWVLSTYCSKKQEIFLWLDMLFILVFYTFICSAWKGGIDCIILHNGVWKYILGDEVLSTGMVEYLLPLDSNTTYSMVVALLMVFFVFKHPKYALDDYSEMPIHPVAHKALLHGRVFVAVAAFAIPAFMVMYNTVTKDAVGLSVNLGGFLPLRSECVFEQEFSGIEGELKSVEVFFSTRNKVNNCEIEVALIEQETNETIGYSTKHAGKMENDQYAEFKMKDSVLNKDKKYSIMISSPNATENHHVAIGTGTEQYANSKAYLNGSLMEDGFLINLIIKE